MGEVSYALPYSERLEEIYLTMKRKLGKKDLLLPPLVRTTHLLYGGLSVSDTVIYLTGLQEP